MRLSSHHALLAGSNDFQQKQPGDTSKQQNQLIQVGRWMALSSFTTRHVRNMKVEYDCCSLPPTIDLLIPPACLNKHMIMIHHHPACQKLESPFHYFQRISKKQGCIPLRPTPRNVEKKGHFTSLGRFPGEIPTLKPSHGKSEVMEINAPDTTRLNSNVKKKKGLEGPKGKDILK